MARANLLRPSVKAGELSPLTIARVDLEQYPFGAATLENFILLPQGGFSRRPGTRFVIEVKDSTANTQLIGFRSSTEEAYPIEAGNLYFRFYKDQGRIVAPDIDAAVINGTFTGGLDSGFAHVWQVDDTPADTAFVDETADANSATAVDWELFPATEAVGDYAAFGLAERFGALVFDYAGGTAGVGGAVAWEYWNGTTWTALTGVTDGTTGFTVAVADGLVVSWTIPADWAQRVISTSSSLYWVRARVTTVYTTNPVMDQGFVRGWTDRSGILELPFDAETSPFTVGLVVTGGTSTHTGTIVAINKGVAGTGAYGVLTLSGATGTFQDNEALTDSGTGAATANRPVAPFGTAAAITHDAVNNRLDLDGLTDDYAWAEQAVATTNTGTQHIVSFEVLGIPGDTAELRIGSSGTANDLIDDQVVGVGNHAFAFTPAASPFFIQFRAKDKTVQIDNVSLLDNTQLELVTPYVTADLPNLRRAQVSDVMYIAHGDYRTRKLLRYGDASWSLEEVNFTGPWLDANITTTTLNPSATTGLGITITADRTAGINGGLGFVSTDVGRQVRIQHTTTWGNAIITTVVSSTEVTADVRTDFGAATAQVNWALGSWSETTGYPASVVFHEGRLAFARTQTQTQTIWLSQSQDFENMQPDSAAGAVEDDDAIARTIASKTGDRLLWLESGPFLTAGTGSAGWVVRSSSQDEALTPANFNARPQITKSSADVDPIQIDDATLFVQAGKRRLILFGLDAELGRQSIWLAVDLTKLADHISGTGLEQLDWQEEPYSLVLGRRVDGQLGVLSYAPKDEQIGWSRWILGGSFGTGDAVVESMTVIPGSTAGNSQDRDEIWLIVKRTINGATVRYVEFFERDFRDGDAQEDAFYVDCGGTYDGAPTSTITGLSFLEGETVSVLADGAIHPDRTVTGGQITLDDTYSVVQAGLKYTSLYKSLKIEVGGVIGPAMTQTKRVGETNLVLDNTLGLQIGPDVSSLSDIPFREVGDPMDTAVPLFTGEKQVEDFPGEWETDPRVVIQSDKPAPATVLAIVPRVETNDNL